MSERDELVDDLADVLARMVVGWKDVTGIDLSEHPDVVRVMKRYRDSKAIEFVTDQLGVELQPWQKDVLGRVMFRVEGEDWQYIDGEWKKVSNIEQCYRLADHPPHNWGKDFWLHCPGNGPFMEEES